MSIKSPFCHVLPKLAQNKNRSQMSICKRFRYDPHWWRRGELKGFGFWGFAWGAVLALGFTPSLHTLQHSDSGLAADVGDAGNIECGDGDGVVLVAS